VHAGRAEDAGLHGRAADVDGNDGAVAHYD
jgi:hypothetical protein